MVTIRTTLFKIKKLRLFIVVEITNAMHRICTTALFYMLALTCFGSSLSSSVSFWIRLSYMKIQMDMVAYDIMLVKWPVCRSVVVQSVVLPS
jgi:hypothetical protein